MMDLQIFLKIAQTGIFAFLLIGCAHKVQPIETLQGETLTKLTLNSYTWHDGSTGGDYGIGVGWTIELLPAEYETVFDVVTAGHPKDTSLITIPAEYEWVKDDSANLISDPIMVNKLVTIPAEYMTVTETVVVEPEHTGYYLSDATYNADGTINTPKTVTQRVIPAKVRQEKRRVVKTPARTVEHMVPIERRAGYRRVVKTPASTKERPWFVGPYYLPKKVEAQPWRFLIKKPQDEIVHIFDDFDDLTTFVHTLK